MCRNDSGGDKHHRLSPVNRETILQKMVQSTNPRNYLWWVSGAPCSARILLGGPSFAVLILAKGGAGKAGSASDVDALAGRGTQVS